MVQPRRGVTLVELIVVIAVMTVMAGVVGLMLRSYGRGEQADDAHLRALLTSARTDALRRGHPVHVMRAMHSRSISADSATGLGVQLVEFTVLPDGRVVGDQTLGIELLTGRVQARNADRAR